MATSTSKSRQTSWVSAAPYAALSTACELCGLALRAMPRHPTTTLSSRRKAAPLPSLIMTTSALSDAAPTAPLLSRAASRCGECGSASLQMLPRRIIQSGRPLGPWTFRQPARRSTTNERNDPASQALSHDDSACSTILAKRFAVFIGDFEKMASSAQRDVGEREWWRGGAEGRTT